MHVPKARLHHTPSPTAPFSGVCNLYVVDPVYIRSISYPDPLLVVAVAWALSRPSLAWSFIPPQAHLPQEQVQCFGNIIEKLVGLHHSDVKVTVTPWIAILHTLT